MILAEAAQHTSELIRDYATVLFYSGTLILAILTYAQAKKTIFTPFKTEAFKLQLQMIGEVMAFFSHSYDHTRKASAKRFDLENCFSRNFHTMIIHYIMLFGPPKKAHFLNPTAISEAFPTGGGIAEDSSPNHPPFWSFIKEDMTPEQKIALWQTYKMPILTYTEKFAEGLDQLSKFMASPVLPNELKKAISNYYTEVFSHIPTIAKVIEATAQELPVRSMNWDDEASIFEEHSFRLEQYSKGLTKIMEKSDLVLEIVQEYLQADALLPRLRKKEN